MGKPCNCCLFKSRSCSFIKGITPKIGVMFYPDKLCSFEPFMCLDFGLERWQSLLFEIFVFPLGQTGSLSLIGARTSLCVYSTELDFLAQWCELDPS